VAAKAHTIKAETYLGPGGGYRCAVCHKRLIVQRTNGKSNRHYRHSQYMAR
jgi:hypothetical protein